MVKRNPIEFSSQNIDNYGYDEEFSQPTVENIVFNPVATTLDRMVQPESPHLLPTAGYNVDLLLEYNGELLNRISKTISGVTYYKDFSYTNGILTGISKWKIL